MKKLLVCLIKGLIFAAILFSFSTIYAENKIRFASLVTTDFIISMENVTQTASNVLEFDIYQLNARTDLQPFELGTLQLGFLLNSDIYTGGTISASISNVGSGLVLGQQFVQSPNNVVSALTGYPNLTLVRQAGRTPVGAGNGTILSAVAPGTLVTHYTITSTVDFTLNSTPNLTFVSSTATSPLYVTSTSEYINSINTLLAVIAGSNAVVNGNPVLNKTIAAYQVSGSGSYCPNDQGIPVGLDSSEIGVTYTLYKDNVAQTPTVDGTGAAISFGNQSAGNYTIKGSHYYGSNTWGATNMTGSAIVVENPANPASVIISENGNDICAGTSITFRATPIGGGTSPTYQWYKNANPIGADADTCVDTPGNGDVYHVVMTSNATCVSGNPATSNSITMIVNPVTASASITASSNPYQSNTVVTITPALTGCGAAPQYKWYVNNLLVSIDSVYGYMPSNGDSVFVVITPSNPCVAATVTSNTIVLTADIGTLNEKINDTDINVSAHNRQIFVSGAAELKRISVYNSMGIMVKILNNAVGDNVINMTDQPSGCYLVKIVTPTKTFEKKVMIE